jgi:hypothetical protein
MYIIFYLRRLREIGRKVNWSYLKQWKHVLSFAMNEKKVERPICVPKNDGVDIDEDKII